MEALPESPTLMASTQSLLQLPTAKTRSRFNLLLLEPGEYYFQDFAVHHYPTPSEFADRAAAAEALPWGERTRLRQAGRLKFCSRSLLFEPSDARLPVLRFPYKHMAAAPLERYRPRSGAPAGDEELFCLRCGVVVEMKPNGKVAPWVTRELVARGAARDGDLRRK